MKIALYGLPCSGKTTLLSRLHGVKAVSGSDKLNSLSKGRFSALPDDEKKKVRVLYTEYIKNSDEAIVISDGHYSFLNEVVFTEEDSEVYDVFIYLYCKPKLLAERYSASDKNRKYSKLMEAHIENWQVFEIESLREKCHNKFKDFYVVDSEKITVDGFMSFIEKINGGYSSYGLAVKIAEDIREIYPQPCRLFISDGDKTVIKQDSFRECVKGYETEVFSGNFYTGYQSLMFSEEVSRLEYDFGNIKNIEINHIIFNELRNRNYIILSAGITRIWNMLGAELGIKNIFSSPLISADTKYFVVKLLKAYGYTITAYGDSKNDLYMLKAADDGYLYAGKISRSLKNADTRGIRLIYDKSPVVLTSLCDDVSDDIAVCKSDSGINGNRLAAAHFGLGRKLGAEIGRFIPDSDTAVLVLERGGRFFGDGIYCSFGGKFYTYNPAKEALPIIDCNNIIIADSVINTGKSVRKVISALKEQNPEVEIFLAANVIQRKAMDLFNDYKLFTVRISDNSFVGKNQPYQTKNTGPDTADRLFNTISLLIGR